MNLLLDPENFSDFSFTLPPLASWNPGNSRYEYYPPPDSSLVVSFFYQGAAPLPGNTISGEIVHYGGDPSPLYLNLLAGFTVVQSILIPYNTATLFSFDTSLVGANNFVLGAAPDSNSPAAIYDRNTVITPMDVTLPAVLTFVPEVFVTPPAPPCYPPVCSCTLPACNGY